jgi:serine/threonine protein phosphatase PrpC
MEKLQAAYNNNQAVRFAFCLLLLLCAIMLFIFSGGFPPWAWRFLAAVLPQTSRLMATQGTGVLLPLLGLLLLSLSLLILWVIIAIALVRVLIAWWRDFYARPPLERELEEAERLSQRMLIHERASDDYVRQAASWMPDDSNNHDWPDTVSAPIAPGFSSYASFENPMPQEMFMATTQEQSVGALYKAAGARESGYARYNPSPGISSRTSSIARTNRKNTATESMQSFVVQPTPQVSQALQAPPAPEIAPSTSSISARSQLRLVPRVEDAPESPQEIEDTRYETIPEFVLPIDLSNKTPSLIAPTTDALEEEHETTEEEYEPQEPALRLNVGIGLDPGIARKNSPNEDNIFAIQGMRMCDNIPEPAGLFMVADGMGGHANGQEASHMAIQTISDIAIPALMRNGSNDDTFRDLLKDGTHRANMAIYQRNRQQEDPVANMMGTTVTAALVVGTTAHVVNVGDSRTYLYRPSEGLRKITRDHSVVARMVEDGTITEDEVYTHPRRNLIYRCLGDHASIDLDAFTVSLQAGDILVLCSDGLWEMVRDPDIARILVSSASHASQISSMLVQAALSRGGADNISVVVVCILDAQS